MSAITFSRRANVLVPSAVREILKVAERADVLSFAGGLPAPGLFPVEAIADAYAHVLRHDGPRALQYGATEGYTPLREWIAARLATRQVRSSVDQLLITSGSQQGIDLLARVLLDPDDVVLTENPTYLAALQAFTSHGARVVPVGSDDDGMRVDELEGAIRQVAAEGGRVRAIYICPDFQNPKGISLSVDRRWRLVEIARRFQVPVIEDDPYGELRFRGRNPPALAALDDDGWVIRLGTFSKTLAPGLRIGWTHGPVELIRKLAVAKQSCDLHTATLAQWATARVLATLDYDAHLDRLRAAYALRRDIMMGALQAHMPPGTRWTQPDGGLFVWLELPGNVRDDEFFAAALERGVAVVPGSGFFVGAPRHGFVRLNFSHPEPELIAPGVARLAAALAAMPPSPPPPKQPGTRTKSSPDLTR